MATETKIVLDANILIRAVLGRKVRNIIEKFANSAQFFTPDVCFADAQKYLPALFEKRNLSADEAIGVLEKLTYLINAVDADLYGIYEIEAKQRIAVRDIDDWTILAVSLMLDCPIWTEDADFFGAGVATWTSDRIHLYLSKGEDI
ncbi:MAG: PIN domain-containing protein [Xenococcaceae cyanobacterium]